MKSLQQQTNKQNLKKNKAQNFCAESVYKGVS